jgi:hypothetical protein
MIDELINEIISNILIVLLMAFISHFDLDECRQSFQALKVANEMTARTPINCNPLNFIKSF